MCGIGKPGLPSSRRPVGGAARGARAALEERIDADLALGRHAEVIPELRALAADDPLREPVTALLMRALYGAGHQAEALTRYEDAKRALADGLGVDPSPELAAVHLAVLRRDPALAARPDTAHAPPPAPRPPKGNLSAPLTSFIGRDADLERVGALLARARLVTLTGPGGAGKTRLSVEAARRYGAPDGPVPPAPDRAVPPAPDGAWLVELAPVTDPGEVPAAVLAALGLREAPQPMPARRAAPPNPLDRVVTALSGRRMLLVLDNCEHLLDAAARLADRVLAGCPGVRIMATSREPLGITGETLWPVGPLEAPPPSASPQDALARPAVRLFADRAAAVAPGFAVTGANVAPVVRICRALDGVPLAIELAAARMRALTPAQVATRLDDRFRLLSAGSRTALPRHRTLRAVVEWSWDLLDEPERALCRRLAAFPGGATLEAAEQVCAGPGLDRAAVLDTLAALVDKSLVTVAGADGEPRYRMLETIRAYGMERLAEAGEEQAVRRAHADCLVRLAEEAEPHLYRAEQLEWLRRLTAEHDNLSAALRWTISTGDAATAVRFCAALGWYWFLNGRLRDGADHLVRILELPDVPADTVTARALAMGAMTSLDNQVIGDHVLVIDWLARARDLCAGADPAALHPGLRLMLTTLELYESGWNHPEPSAVEPLLLDPDPWVRGLAHYIRGQIALNFGWIERLDDDFGRSLAAFREAGDRWGLSFALSARAEVVGRRGDHRTAVALHEEALRLNAELGGGTVALVHVHMRLANELDLIGERDRAEELLHAALEAALLDGVPLRRPEEVAALHYQLGEFARRSGEEAEARRRLTLAEELTDGLPGPQQFRAMVLCSRGQLDMAMGAMDDASARLHEALRGAAQAQDHPILAYVLAGLAERCRLLGDPERAAVLLGTGDALRGTRDLSQPDVLAIEAAVRADLGADAFAAAYERGLARALEDVLSEFGLDPPPRPTMTRPPGAGSAAG